MTPGNLVILPFHFNRINKPTVKITIINPWIIISENSVVMFRNTMVLPSTKSIFIIFEPMIFPIIIPVSPCLAAERDAASSGNEVPSATIDIPMAIEETPKSSAIPVAPSTNSVAPTANPITPGITCIIKRKLFVSTEILFSFLSS